MCLKQQIDLLLIAMFTYWLESVKELFLTLLSRFSDEFGLRFFNLYLEIVCVIPQSSFHVFIRVVFRLTIMRMTKSSPILTYKISFNLRKFLSPLVFIPLQR